MRSCGTFAGSTAGHLRHTFYDCFTSFAIAADQLWAAVSGKAVASSKPAMSADVKLLVLHSNCVHMRTHVLKDLTARCLAAFPRICYLSQLIQGFSRSLKCGQ